MGTLRRRKTPRRRLEDQADALFREIVRLPGVCKRCGSNYMLQTAHIISRSYHQIRWSLDNAICLCAKCHVYFTHHPVEWEIWIKKLIGEEKYNELQYRAIQYHIPIDYELIVARLKEELNVRTG